MRRLGFTKQRELADFFAVSETAVSLWPADAPLPEKRILQLQVRRPDLFTHQPRNQDTAPDS